jgi:RNA polymerase sigma-70 factor (ECF subfamily)
VSGDGPSSGLQAIFFDNRAALLRFLRATGANETAEDLLQELWIKIVAQPTQPISRPLPYLYQMANNLMLDRWRSQERAREREKNWSDHAGMDAREVAASDRSLMATEQLRQVEAVLSALGERTSRIFFRFRLEGATQHQIAQEYGISLSAVEKHLQKAYRALLELKKHSDAE